MRTYAEAAELAKMCARNARASSEKQVARELWKMAQEYQAEAAKLDDGRLLDLGTAPRLRDTLNQINVPTGSSSSLIILPPIGGISMAPTTSASRGSTASSPLSTAHGLSKLKRCQPRGEYESRSVAVGVTSSAALPTCAPRRRRTELGAEKEGFTVRPIRQSGEVERTDLLRRGGASLERTGRLSFRTRP
jgi:hypothetical protein